MDKFAVLLQEARALRSAAFAQSTKSTYNSYMNAYFRYCKYFQRVPVPADQLTLVGYLAFLARSLNPSSIGGYLNVIRILHVSVGLENPLQDNWELDMLKKAFARLKGSPPVQKFPITLTILAQISSLLNFSSPTDLCFWAALLIGFFGFLRKSTLLLKTCSSLPSSGICRSDVFNITTSSFSIVIRHSKTIQFGQRVLALPFAACSVPLLCPVRALLFHLVASPMASDRPLFSYSTPAGFVVLSQVPFVKRLKSLLAVAGYKASQYSAHSLRRGGASFAFNSGVSPLIIKARGDWSSNAFERYVFLTEHSTMAAAELLAANTARAASP